MVEKSGNELTVRSNGIFIWLALGMIFLSVFGILLLIYLFPLDKNELANCIFGVVTLVIWTSFNICMGIYAMAMYSKKIIINEEGITAKTFLSKKQLLWNEISDFGISFDIWSQHEGNTYDLYFSRLPQKEKNEYKKKLKGELIKITVYQKFRNDVLETVIPYCQKRTTVVPFIGKSK